MLKQIFATGAIVTMLLRWQLFCPWAKRNVAQRYPKKRVIQHPGAKADAVNRIGVVLVNLGTPTKSSPWFVRKFLIEFLFDNRVIDSLPGIIRAALVYFIITPIRCFTSGISYNRLWKLHHGKSPLLTYSQKLCTLVQESLGERFIVKYGMRYQEPALSRSMNDLCDRKCRMIIFIPLFPQYASSSTGSAVEWIMRFLGKWEIIPNCIFVSDFFSHPKYISAMVHNLSPEISGVYLRSFDHVLFSYHGLPWRHVSRVCDHCDKVDVSERPFPRKYNPAMINKQSHVCMNTIDDKNAYCYRAHCYATTRFIAEKMHLDEKKLDVVFQSRFGSDPWLQPYAEEVIKSLPSVGKKRVAIIGPSFVTDCLETTCELGEEYKNLFLESGGIEWFLFPALNASTHWVDALSDIIQEKAVLF